MYIIEVKVLLNINKQTEEDVVATAFAVLVCLAQEKQIPQFKLIIKSPERVKATVPPKSNGSSGNNFEYNAPTSHMIFSQSFSLV